LFSRINILFSHINILSSCLNFKEVKHNTFRNIISPFILHEV
jgi:hypothetical protein